jgi:hypothetical protein
MSTFIADKKEIEAFDKKLKQEGMLCLQTRIDIKGNHLKGPVTVSIRYEANFLPNERYWEVDAEHPDEEPYPIRYVKEFKSNEEREFFVSSFFNI